MSQQGSYTQSLGAVSCSLGALPASGSTQVTIVVEADKAETMVNSATVAANESEPNTATNNEVTVFAVANVDLTGTGYLLQTSKQSGKPG
jgi:hypothetical protein